MRASQRDAYPARREADTASRRGMILAPRLALWRAARRRRRGRGGVLVASTAPTARRPPMALCITVVLSGLLALAACAQPGDSQVAAPTAAVAAPAEEALQITVAPVAVRPTKRLLKFVGTLFGNEEVTLSSQVEGQITSLHADLGDEVATDEVLLDIDDASMRAQLREAEAHVVKARADEARGRELLRANIISLQEYESMQTAMAVAEAQRDSLNVTLRHKQVRSPLSGSVAKRLVSVGEYVRPGTPLFDLVDDDPLTLRGDVPERFAQELAVAQPVQIRVDAYPDDLFEGRLLRISPAANAENRSIAVEAEVPNAAHKLKAGFFASAGIVTRADDQALVVPETAVTSFAGVTKLFVVRDDVAYERHVRIGTRDDEGMVEVVEGLHADEVVATSGLAKLENGVAVVVRKGDS